MFHEVKAPRVNANEDEVLVTDVLVSTNDWIDIGQAIFVVETSKAAVSVEAQVSGYIRSILVEVDSMVEVGAMLCLITDTKDEPLPDTGPSRTGADTYRETRVLEARVRLTAKERLEAHRKATSTSREGFTSVKEPTGVRPVEVIVSSKIPWACEARAALERLSSDDGELVINVFEKLPEVKRGEVYRAKGTRIDADAQLGNGSVIRAKRLYLGPGVQIGDDCYIEADSVYIGALSKVGNQTNIVTGELILGKGVVVTDEVIVDLSGGRSDESRLLVGNGSLIASRALINTCREVVLEEESAISPGAMLFTHSFWQSVLEGYSIAFQGVRVCQNAWVGAGCQVLPGVKIGPGSVVMSNSTVIEDVPPFSLVGGIPAQVLRSNIRRELDRRKRIQILQKILEDFVHQLEFKGCTIKGSIDAGKLLITLPDGQARNLILLTSDQFTQLVEPLDSILITLGQEVSASDQASVFDVVNGEFAGVEDHLTHEIRNFLRRHGIRFKPFAWDPHFVKGL